MINISVQKQGPLYSGQLTKTLAEAIDAGEEEIATQGANHLRDDLGVPPFKAPTGWYRSHITPKRMGSYWVIQDSGVIYGPWLAGTGSRNATSRFKGYRHWQRAVTYTYKISKGIMERFIARALGGG